jgi:hypothetical protein
MMHDEDLSKLLSAVRADADPALWTRVRSRLATRERAGAAGWLAWAMRPAALGASLAVFAGALAVSAALVATAPQTTTVDSYSSLTEALVADIDGTAAAPAAPAATPAAPAAPAPGATSDSGGVR